MKCPLIALSIWHMKNNSIDERQILTLFGCNTINVEEYYVYIEKGVAFIEYIISLILCSGEQILHITVLVGEDRFALWVNCLHKRLSMFKDPGIILAIIHTIWLIL